MCQRRVQGDCPDGAMGTTTRTRRLSGTIGDKVATKFQVQKYDSFSDKDNCKRIPVRKRGVWIFCTTSQGIYAVLYIYMFHKVEIHYYPQVISRIDSRHLPAVTIWWIGQNRSGQGHSTVGNSKQPEHAEDLWTADHPEAYGGR